MIRPGNITHRYIFLFVAAALLPLPLHGQGVVGVVRDSDSRAPVPSARVVLLRDTATIAVAITDGAGAFRVDASAGDYRLRVEALGYAANLSQVVHLARGEVISAELLISPRPISLEPLLVVGRGEFERGRFGFARRRELDRGVFLTRDSIRDRYAVVATDAFYGVPKIVVDPGLNPRIRSMAGGKCLVIYVDNIATPFASTGIRQWGRGVAGFDQLRTVSDSVGLNALVNVDWIEGIEIYPSSTDVPPELRKGMRVYDLWPPGQAEACGMAWIWTRAGW